MNSAIISKNLIISKYMTLKTIGKYIAAPFVAVGAFSAGVVGSVACAAALVAYTPLLVVKNVCIGIFNVFKGSSEVMLEAPFFGFFCYFPGKLVVESVKTVFNTVKEVIVSGGDAALIALASPLVAACCVFECESKLFECDNLSGQSHENFYNDLA